MNTKFYQRSVPRFLSKRICWVFLLIFATMTLIPLLASGQVGELQTEKESTVRARGLSITDQQGKQVALYKESHALVIGISNYTKGWPKLPGVQRDVEAVKAALEAQGFNVIVKMDLDKNALEQAFNEFINAYGFNPENRLLLYLAGHGHTRKKGYGDEMGYIVPANAPLPDKDEPGFLAKAMDMQMIETYAKRIESKHALFLFDSCFSGSIFALSRAAPESITYKTGRPVRQFITSGRADEQVPDESVFRQQFIMALHGEGDTNKDGYVTGSELGIFLEDTVINYTKGAQHPQYGRIRDRYLDKGDFVFKLPEKPEEKPTPTPLRPPEVTSSFDELKIQIEWQEYLSKMEDAFSTAQRYEKLDFAADAKIAAWEQFITTFSVDNPYSTRDEELRSMAQAQIQFWKERMLATPTPPPLLPTPTPILTSTPLLPTPTPVPTATPQPPTPTPQPPTPTPTATPEPVFRINNVVIKDTRGKVIQPVNGIYALNAGEPVTITVNVTKPQEYPVRFTWTAGHGNLSSKSKPTTRYTAKKSEADYVLIRIEDKKTGRTLQKSLNMTVVALPTPTPTPQPQPTPTLTVSEINWPDYRKPLSQDMRVFQYKQHKIESATITVNLPEEFLNKHKEIILIVDLEARTEGGFKAFSPFFRINRSILFKTSGIPVKDLPYRQTAETKINRKHLKAGQNTLQATFRWKGNYYCSGVGCGYVIHKMSFKDAPPLGYTLEIASKPSGAKVFLERKYKGTTPLRITELRKQTYRIRIEKDGYEPIEDKIVLITDSARTYELAPNGRGSGSGSGFRLVVVGEEPSQRTLLRSEPLTVSDDEAQKAFGLDEKRRPLKYIENDFEVQGDVVIDHATGLMWQKSGSDEELTYKEAQAYIEQLNRERFAGYENWRLPTVEELMSLLEPVRQLNGLYINPLFDANQKWCWSADKSSSESAWDVVFTYGYVHWRKLGSEGYVRVVRS